jgi:hypothetical protein
VCVGGPDGHAMCRRSSSNNWYRSQVGLVHSHTNLGSQCVRDIVGNSPTLCGDGGKAWFIWLRVQPPNRLVFWGSVATLCGDGRAPAHHQGQSLVLSSLKNEHHKMSYAQHRTWTTSGHHDPRHCRRPDWPLTYVVLSLSPSLNVCSQPPSGHRCRICDTDLFSVVSPRRSA